MNHHPHCFLHEHCLPEWKAAIASNARPTSFKKGAVVFREGDPVEGFYFIHTGKVKVHKQWGEEGKDLILKFAGEGNLLGHRGLVSGDVYPVSATVVEPVEACFITPEFFQATMLVNHQLAYRMILLYADELQQAEQSMRDMVHMNVKSRIAKSLLKLEEIFGKDEEGYINGGLSRQDVASYAGTTYETLFKTINEWAAEGIVASAGKQLAILHTKKLRKLIQ
ncbi:Crp/Fnr family transcriptional regulator [Chitinophaga barathri]|uniref:Crp/Fnr family transcriptional regulator n=1 Tax=Chitinophaga barathri TaxID=1647451 RepID=A0A3N4M8F4_9BACT|nr:Crp/Fnr family transcriptional regulator [Chitinophaga barathri]RPD39862.1 Crp/Fnr family transcriptional regulator [Chitinophaga barathri]